MRLLEKLEARPNAILAFSDIETIDTNSNREIQAYTALDGIECRIYRAHRMLLQRGIWWIPYRGIFRSVAVDRIGGLRTNLAGEFAADWPWLVHLSLLGEFVRVPEVLYKKVQRKKSLSRNWNYTIGAWFAATLACAGEIYRSRLSLFEKMLLQISLAGAFLRCIWRWLLPYIT